MRTGQGNPGNGHNGSARRAAERSALRFSPLLPADPPPHHSRDPWQLEWLGAEGLRQEFPGVVVDGHRVDGYEYRNGRGAQFLYPHDLVARLTSRSGQRIVLPARSLHHIEHEHGADSSRNRFASGITPRWLLEQLPRRLPDPIVYEWREARVEFESDQPVGEDEVASIASLIKAGVVSRKLVKALEAWREELLQLNLFGSAEQQRAFVAERNWRLAATPASLIMRRSSILVQVATAARPTSWFSVVVFHDSHRRLSEGEVGQIRTLYPGRVRPPYPGARWFFSHYGADRPSRGMAILDRLRAGQPLDRLYQARAVSAQRQAQAFWWQHAITGQVV